VSAVDPKFSQKNPGKEAPPTPGCKFTAPIFIEDSAVAIPPALSGKSRDFPSLGSEVAKLEGRPHAGLVAHSYRTTPIAQSSYRLLASNVGSETLWMGHKSGA
jgi:hypothetical protein